MHKAVQLELFEGEKQQEDHTEKRKIQLNVIPSTEPILNASYFQRAIAFIIDILTIKIIMSFSWTFFKPAFTAIAGINIANGNPGGSQALFLILSEASLLLWYFSISSYLFSTTPGKYFMGLQVISDRSTRVTIIRAIVRHLPLFFLYVLIPGYFSSLSSLKTFATIFTYLFLLNLIFPLFRKDSKAIHDLIGRTHVIRAK